VVRRRADDRPPHDGRGTRPSTGVRAANILAAVCGRLGASASRRPQSCRDVCGLAGNEQDTLTTPALSCGRYALSWNLCSVSDECRYERWELSAAARRQAVTPLELDSSRSAAALS